MLITPLIHNHPAFTVTRTILTTTRTTIGTRRYWNLPAATAATAAHWTLQPQSQPQPQPHSQPQPQRRFMMATTTDSATKKMNVAARPSDLVGNTPLLDLQRILDQAGIMDEPRGRRRLLGKLESLGPCGSVKDRLGRSLIDEAEKAGQITPGRTVLVEPTSGNTGIALAFIARERGYECILTMPETMSIERRMMLLALGCQVVLTPKETAVKGAIAKAHEILQELEGRGCMLQQFENPANPLVHRETTGPEIWRDTAGQIDMFVAGVGTGGTITGVSQFIKGYPGKEGSSSLPPLNPHLYTVAVEPMEQMLLTAAKTGGAPIGPQGPHKIQGIGAGIVPPILDLNLIDEVVPIHSDTAMDMTHQLWHMGVPTGVSAGAIVAGAVHVLSKPEHSDKQVCVCILPSFGERYFSHPMFADIKAQAEQMTKQPLPAPFDNREYGFATERG